MLPDITHACGWWGDSEMSSRRETAIVTPEGMPVEHTLNLKNMKLPGRMGYGIAIPEPGKAIPYLLATFGQPLNKIQDLKVFGFRGVIDLGTPERIAYHHREETKNTGMRYSNIHLNGDMPNNQQTEDFIKAVLEPQNIPLLVYASRADMIAVMWASYRLKMGSPMAFTLHEGRSLGLTLHQEEALRNRTR